jgi:hypothetical protein
MYFQVRAFTGIGKETYENSTCKNYLTKAKQILGFRITDVMFGRKEPLLG